MNSELDRATNCGPFEKREKGTHVSLTCVPSSLPFVYLVLIFK